MGRVSNNWQTADVIKCPEDKFEPDGTSCYSSGLCDSGECVECIFDYNWQFDPLFLEKGDPEIRAQCPYRKVMSDLSTTIVGLPKIDPQVFDNYVGDYKADAGFVVKIMKDGDKLMGQGPGGPPVQLFPYTETEYFLDVMDLQITFVKDESGKVSELIIHERDEDIPAKKAKWHSKSSATKSFVNNYDYYLHK